MNPRLGRPVCCAHSTSSSAQILANYVFGSFLILGDGIRKGSKMKVVIFCGGFGMRLREYKENIHKPMVPIVHLPILWHVMKYYAHFGHKDFLLCVGYCA